jgi:uncharacterized lipoprotein YddW (UPF0748 family)
VQAFYFPETKTASTKNRITQLVMKKLFLLFFVLPALLAAQPKREFRAVWIATVDNIDFPSKKNLTADEQQAEFIKLLDAHQQTGCNAVIVQVRPAADAFYKSDLEPYSEWLTGTQGKPPDPFYDPLEFMIAESRKRGLEFHAWINPYRAVFDTDSSSIAPNHITKQKPEWFFRYGKKTYFNPGIPAVRDYIVKIILDIAARYDIDAVHFDDYFYPYFITGQPLTADSMTFAQFAGGITDLGDWRRSNIDELIKTIHLQLRELKPHVKFGVSPFAVWRNKKNDSRGSETEAGQPTYDYLYADIRTWLQNGWIDYVAPQLYFHRSFAKVPYETMLNWWIENSFGKHLYIGHAAYRVGTGKDSAWRNPSELPAQILLNRRSPVVKGSIYFSSKSLVNNPLGIRDSLRQNFYRYPALIPPMTWIDSIPPRAPTEIASGRDDYSVWLSWLAPEKARDGDTARNYVVYRFRKNDPRNLNDAAKILAVQSATSLRDLTAASGETYTYIITALDKLSNESAPSREMVIEVK